MTVNALTVALAALVTALATGLGALPLLFVRRLDESWRALGDAAAAGFMLSASAALVWEGAARDAGLVVAGAAIGVAFMLLTRRALSRRDDLHVGHLRGADAAKAVGIVAVMTVHSLTEGVGVGVSYGDGKALGLFITAAIAVHNIPEGLAISLVLVPRGTRVLTAAWWSVFSSLPQPLVAVPAFVFVEHARGLLPAGLGFAAGAMAAMVMSELLPDARRGAAPRPVAATLAAAFGAMTVLQLVLLRA